MTCSYFKIKFDASKIDKLNKSKEFFLNFRTRSVGRSILQIQTYKPVKFSSDFFTNIQVHNPFFQTAIAIPLILRHILLKFGGCRFLWLHKVWRCFIHQYTAISRKAVEKTVHATIPKGNMGYDQYTVPDTVAVEPTLLLSFSTRKH